MVKLLLDHDSDVDAKDLWEMTPLHLACGRGHIEVAMTLLDYGADVDAVSSMGEETPLHQAASECHT